MHPTNNKVGDLFKGIHHFGIIVSNMGNALKLYRDTLGFAVERDTGEEGLDSHYVSLVCKLTGVNAQKVRIVYLQRYEVRIELLQFIGIVENKRDRNYQGCHIATNVKNFTAAYEELRRIGLIPISKPQTIPSGPNTGKRVVYLKDEDGSRIELIGR